MGAWRFNLFISATPASCLVTLSSPVVSSPASVTRISLISMMVMVMVQSGEWFIIQHLIGVLLLVKLLKVTEDNLDGATYNFVVHSFVIGVTVTFMNIFHTL